MSHMYLDWNTCIHSNREGSLIRAASTPKDQRNGSPLWGGIRGTVVLSGVVLIRFLAVVVVVVVVGVVLCLAILSYNRRISLIVYFAFIFNAAGLHPRRTTNSFGYESLKGAR